VSATESDLVLRLGRHIGELRRQRGLTQAQFGEMLGIAQKNVHRLESGTQNLTLRTLEKVAAALSVDVDTLWRAANAAPFLRDAHVALASHSQLAPRPIPVFGIAAAAGFARHGQLADVKGWALLDQPVDERHFLAQIDGDSMLPTITSGTWGLFRRCTTVPVSGAVVLVELERDVQGGRYLVKRLRSLKRDERGRAIVILGSDNDAYAPLELRAESDDDVRIVAEFVEVVAGDIASKAPSTTRAAKAGSTRPSGRGRATR
jgi:transcriptional regulator with XRE-family HTH domain